jgi:hypothetical protein
MSNELRKGLAIAAIIIGGTAVAIPDVGDYPLSKILMAFATALNAASLYLLKEEAPNVPGPSTQE